MPEIIENVPFTVEEQEVDTNSTEANMGKGAVALVEAVPGVEESTFKDPEDTVKEIKQQLASRPAGAGRPEVRAGGPDGQITVRGGSEQ